MSRLRVAILISGRGSNMAALIEAAKDKTYPAEIALVVSNRPDAGGLATAHTAGIDGALMRVEPFERRQQCGMNIEQLALPLVDESGTEQPHEPGKADDIDIVLLQYGLQRVFECGAVLAVGRVIDDGCGDCHLPHASKNIRLLSKNLTLDRLALFDPKQAELCLGCHDLETFTKLQTEATGFRIGTTNLHALHISGGGVPNKYGIIKKKDGQTCFACHLPHTAHQEKLLRTEYQCTGTFCYTMRFVQNTNGGTCVVGCHKPKMYSRVGEDPNATAGAAPGGKQVVR